MKYFNFLAAAALLCIYALGNIPPSERFNLWLVAFVIPFALVLNIILILVGLVMRKKSTLFLLAVLIFGGDYLFSTVGITSIFKGENSQDKETFTVLSYNLGGFNTGYFPGMNGKDWVKADSLQKSMIQWVLNADADIQCYQEFRPFLALGEVNMLKELEDRGYAHYFSSKENDRDTSSFGTLIVSRFPILGSGDVLASENGFNRISFVDLLVFSDTIRIINVHLQSMQMKAFHPGYSEDFQHRRHDVKVVLRKLKTGVFERSKQIERLIEFLKTSPYPVICAGDFNEMPYSYSYRNLRKNLKNSFEESGSGFGFTYNGNTLSMLRIDNQFYSDALESISLETLDTVSYTDHFPIFGSYAMRSL